MDRNIQRLAGTALTRSCVAALDQWVFTVATARASSPGVEAQARAALDALEQNLHAGGSDKSHILFALVFLADIKTKPELNRAWDAWVDREEPPVRACVQAELEGGDLVEVVAVAAKCRDAIPKKERGGV
jgi:enamine deaminase RidA (YjgF/YER057c/UK114 family)